MLFTVLTMKRGCAARMGESSGNLTNTLLTRVGFFFVSVWAGLAGRLGGVGVPIASAYSSGVTPSNIQSLDGLIIQKVYKPYK